MKKIYVFLCMVFMLNIAYGAQQSLQPGEFAFWFNLLKGAGIGVFTVVIGWAKKQDPGKFNWKGLSLRLPTGVIVGVISAYQGLDFNDAYTWAAGVGIIMIVDNVSKMVIRRAGWFKKQKEEKDDKETVSN